MECRLITDETPRNAFANMARDYAILLKHGTPTLRLYRWSPPAVSVGRFQSLKDEVDVAYCREQGIDFVRRITGGGAVFHEHEVTYSFCIPEKNPLFPPGLHDSYRAICGAVIRGLALLGMRARYAPINDVLCSGKKISGCAQTRKQGRILQHGTILLDVDVEKMFRVLRVPQEKISDKMVADVKERVTGISAELGRSVVPSEVMRAIASGFEKEFSISLRERPLSPEEESLMKDAELSLFRSDSWRFER